MQNNTTHVLYDDILPASFWLVSFWFASFWLASFWLASFLFFDFILSYLC